MIGCFVISFWYCTRNNVATCYQHHVQNAKRVLKQAFIKETSSNFISQIFTWKQSFFTWFDIEPKRMVPSLQLLIYLVMNYTKQVHVSFFKYMRTVYIFVLNVWFLFGGILSLHRSCEFRFWSIVLSLYVVSCLFGV